VVDEGLETSTFGLTVQNVILNGDVTVFGTRIRSEYNKAFVDNYSLGFPNAAINNTIHSLSRFVTDQFRDSAHACHTSSLVNSCSKNNRQLVEGEQKQILACIGIIWYHISSLEIMQFPLRSSKIY
jgi:hypothetical protein